MFGAILAAAAATLIVGGFLSSSWAHRDIRPKAESSGSPRRIPLVAEAMGYIGAILVLSGAAAAVGQRWDAMTDWAHVGVYGGAAALFFAVGVLVLRVREAAVQRMIAVGWLGGQGCR